MRYFFIFGNHPRLASAELAAVLDDVHFWFEGNYAIVESIREFNLATLQERFGGVVKCGVVLKNMSRTSFFDDVYQHIHEAAQGNQKFSFGISAYGVLLPIQQLGLSLKKRFKDEGVASRFVTSKQPNLSSVVVKTNKLLTDSGCELVAMQTHGETALGVTQAVQPFAELSLRDYGRPARDAKSGMIPPKLARMMINMARVLHGGTILDPFCGSGTIMQEALLMGYKNVIGADVSEKAIERTRNNLTWLSSVIPSAHSNTARLIIADARALKSVIPPHSIDAIVTEPYLGPPLKGNEQESGLFRTMRDLEQLYRESIEECAKILKLEGMLVIVFPIIQNKRISLECFMQSGFTQYPSFTKFYNDQKRASFVYRRPGQRVVREIFVLRNS